MSAPFGLMKLKGKARLELHKDATCCFKQRPTKIAAWLLTSNHTNKTNSWESKDEIIINICLRTHIHKHTTVNQPAKIYINKLYADTGCCLEDLPRVISIGTAGKKDSRKSMLSTCFDDNNDSLQNCAT